MTASLRTRVPIFVFIACVCACLSFAAPSVAHAAEATPRNTYDWTFEFQREVMGAPDRHAQDWYGYGEGCLEPR